MKKPSRNDWRLEDDDMTSLFASQNVRVPEELKQSVFAQAERQLTMDNAPAADIVAADNRLRHDSDLPGDSITGGSTQSHRFHTRSRWLAVAATALIAVAVTPVLLKTPDSIEAPEELAESEATLSAAPAAFSMDAQRMTTTNQLIEGRTAPSSSKPMRMQASDGATGGAAGDSDINNSNSNSNSNSNISSSSST